MFVVSLCYTVCTSGKTAVIYQFQGGIKMKKIIVLCFVLLVIFVPISLFISSCDSAGEDYYIRFTLDGQEYILTFGYTDESTDAPVVALQQISDTQDLIVIYGSNWKEGGDTSGILINFLGTLRPYVQGEHLGDYTLEEINGLNSVFVGYGYLSLEIFDIPDMYLYRATAGTVTITSFGDVGGAVEGTFDVTLTYMVPLDLGDPTLPVTGDFRLLRVSEDDFPID